MPSRSVVEKMTTHQRVLFRAVVLVIILMVLAMFDLIRRTPTVVY
jgi:hypothetical protein